MSLALRRLADEVGVSERTLRRGVGSELIRARRISSHRLVVAEGEAEWVRLHWSLIGRLRGALRTEPNLELVVLFGSVARGDDLAGISDVDLLVELRRPYPGALEALRGRLNERVRPDVQLVPLKGALRDPGLLAEVLRDGRPLVDRSGSWPELRAQAEQAHTQADRAGREIQEGARAAIGYFQRLAAARAQASVGAGR
ncbi:MAG TPA: nucleotidyltransferase domain-containing protein [Solirubrobacteraceae bacterium]|jgi:predicted nucleotidyltransferase|nr:nucleotidyltransferase domain-containing protein [Solirubrobacteraceae bacterium]